MSSTILVLRRDVLADCWAGISTQLLYSDMVTMFRGRFNPTTEGLSKEIQLVLNLAATSVRLTKFCLSVPAQTGQKARVY